MTDYQLITSAALLVGALVGMLAADLGVRLRNRLKGRR